MHFFKRSKNGYGYFWRSLINDNLRSSRAQSQRSLSYAEAQP